MEYKANQDIDGNTSSKRVMGILLVRVAILMAVVHWIVGLGMAIAKKQFLYEFPIDIWWTLIGLGSSLLGITLAERFGINTGSFKK